MSDTIFKIPKLKGSSNQDIQSIKLEALLIREGYLEVIATDITSLDTEQHSIL